MSTFRGLTAYVSFPFNFPEKSEDVEKLAQYLNQHCEEYVEECRALLDAVKSQNEDVIVQKYGELVSLTHDSTGEIRNIITNITLPTILNDMRSRSLFEAKLDEREYCGRSRVEFHYRKLTKIYKNWRYIEKHRIPPAIRYFPREPINPWIGYTDERTAPMFLEEFTEKLQWYPEGARIIRKFLSYLQGPDVESFVRRVRRDDTMEMIAKNFYEEFTSETEYCREIDEFTIAECPQSSDEEVLNFARLWLGKFHYNPKVTMRWVTNMLVDKMPARFATPLEVMLDGEEPLSRFTIPEELSKCVRRARFTINTLDEQARMDAEYEAQLEPSSSSEESD